MGDGINTKAGIRSSGREDKNKKRPVKGQKRVTQQSRLSAKGSLEAPGNKGARPSCRVTGQPVWRSWPV